MDCEAQFHADFTGFAEAQKSEIDNMLKSELKTTTNPVKATFKREGPLRIEHFRRVAEAFGLPMA